MINDYYMHYTLDAIYRIIDQMLLFIIEYNTLTLQYHKIVKCKSGF